MVSKKKHTANKFQVVKAEILGIIDCCPDVISSAAFDRRIFFGKFVGRLDRCMGLQNALATALFIIDV